MPLKTHLVHILSLSMLLVLWGLAPDASAATYLNATTSAGSWDAEGTEGDSAAQHLELYTSTSLAGYRLEVSGYGRAATGSVDGGDSEDLSRLYSLTLGITSRGGGTSIILGRQFVSSLTGPDQMDGVALTKDSGDLTLAARYGHLSEISSADANNDNVLGLGFDYRIKKGMAVSMDYSRTFDDDALLTELIALDWSYSWHRYTRAYFLLNWDLMSQTIHEAQLGARLFFSDRFTWILEYSQSVQIFDSDSIYSVFAVDAAETTSMVLLFTPTRNTRYTWEYALEGYQEGGGGRRYSVAGKWTPGTSAYDLSLEQHSGYGGTLTEIRAAARQQLMPGLDVGIGGDLARTENPGEDTLKSHMLYTGLSWSPNDRITASLRLEQSGDDLLDSPESTSRLSLSWEF